MDTRGLVLQRSRRPLKMRLARMSDLKRNVRSCWVKQLLRRPGPTHLLRNVVNLWRRLVRRTSRNFLLIPMRAVPMMLLWRCALEILPALMCFSIRILWKILVRKA